MTLITSTYALRMGDSDTWRLLNRGSSTVYYHTDASVSSSVNEGNVTSGGSATLVGPKYLICGAGLTCEVLVLDSTGATTAPSSGASVYGTGGLSTARIYSPGAAIDVAPTIQAAIDAGATDIILDAYTVGTQDTFLLNSPIFDDSTLGSHGGGPQSRSVTIRSTTNATIKLGANLPLAANTVNGDGTLATGAWTGDAASRWAFFPNTLRSAYSASANVVQVANGTAVNGVSQSAPFGRLRFRNLVIDGGNESVYNPAGLAFGNQCNIRVEDTTCRNLTYLFTWLGYCDMPALIRVTAQEIGHAAEGPKAASTLMVQQNAGDGVVIDSVHCAGNIVIWDAFGCKGGLVRGSVSSGGFIFSHCDGIVFDGQHMEMTQVGHSFPNIVCKNSKITVRSCFWTTSVTSGYYFFDIEDTASGLNINDASVVKFQDCVAVFLLNAGTDPVRTADVRIGSLMLGGSVTFDNFKYAMLDTGGVTEFQGASPLITAANANQQNALLSTVGTSRRLSATAASRWSLRTSTGASANPWVVETVPGAAGARLLPPTSTPTVATPVTSSAAGTLTNAQAYEYAAATIGDDGSLSAVSTAASAAAGANGTLRVAITVPTSPNGLIVWRKTGTGVLATPDNYIIIPTDSSNTQLVDTGVNVNGLPWIPSAIPAPSGYTTNVGARLWDPVAASTALLSTLVVVPPSYAAASRYGMVAHSLPSSDWSAATNALTGGTMYMCRVVVEVDTPSAARTMKVGQIAAATGATLVKAAAWDTSGNLLGTPTNDSANWLGTNALKTPAMGTFALTKGQEVFLTLLIVGSSLGTIERNARPGSANILNVGLLTSSLLFATYNTTGLTDIPASPLTPTAWTAYTDAMGMGIS